MAVSASAIRQYPHTRLGQLTSERASFNLIAVVSDVIRRERSSRGARRDAFVTVALCDETRERLLGTAFAAGPDQLPRLSVGCVVVAHRVKCELFNGELRLSVCPRVGGAVYVLPAAADVADGGDDDDDDDEAAAAVSADRRRLKDGANVTDADLARVQELRRWFRRAQRTLPSSVEAFIGGGGGVASASSTASSGLPARCMLSDLSGPRFRDNPGGGAGCRQYFDLLAQLVSRGRLSDNCSVVRLWDGTQAPEVLRAGPDTVLDDWPDLPAARLGQRLTVDVFVYDEHRDPLLLPAANDADDDDDRRLRLGDLVELANVSARWFTPPDGPTRGRRLLVLALNGGGQRYNRRLRRLDPAGCALAARLRAQLAFVRRSLPLPPAATVVDERYDSVQRVGLADLIKSATGVEAWRLVVTARLARLLPADSSSGADAADRFVCLVCPACGGVDVVGNGDRRRSRGVCARCPARAPLRARLCLGLHLKEFDPPADSADVAAEVMAFAWDGEAERLLGDGDDSVALTADQLAADAGLRRSAFARLRRRLPAGARVDLAVVHFRASAGPVCFHVVDTRLAPPQSTGAAV